MAPGRAGREPGGHGRAQCVRSVVLCVRLVHETNGVKCGLALLRISFLAHR